MIRKRCNAFIVLMTLLILGAPRAYSESRVKGKMPPANVVVFRMTSGVISPEGEFIGTVYYPEVSEVPAEVSVVLAQRLDFGDFLGWHQRVFGQVRRNAPHLRHDVAARGGDFLHRLLGDEEAMFEGLHTTVEKTRD